MLSLARSKDTLDLSPSTFAQWAHFNGVRIHGGQIQAVPFKGNGLIATEHLQNSADEAKCLLTVPKDLILSAERVREHAGVDKDLRDTLEACGELCQTARGSILVFLLLQATTACGAAFGNIGVHSPFVEYVKSLPSITLPNSWNEEALDLLVGTTLLPAARSKLRSLRREYDQLCTSCSGTKWYRSVETTLTFADWIEVDAMYRSRALEYPGVGNCMVPVLDLANHQSGDGTIATYDVDAQGNAILLLRKDKQLEPGDEITISYGDEKGACEMLFSYGFLERSMLSAEALYLDLDMPNEDLLSVYKRRFADCAPGVKLVDTGDGQIDWQGDYIWLLCATTDDGLRFEVARLNDGSEEVQAFFGDTELNGGAIELRRRLAMSKMWDVYQLRATALLQDRVFQQLQILDESQAEVEDSASRLKRIIGEDRCNQAMQLRKLEFELLNQAYEDLERQKLDLAESEVVKSYLNAVNATDGEDFS